MALAPGTPIPGSSDPKTAEQVATIQRLIAGTDTSALPPQYRGALLYPDGQLTRDYSVLVKPPMRVSEIDAILAAGTDPAKPSGGYVLALNTDGIPIQYMGVSMSTPATTPAQVVSAAKPIPVRSVDGTASTVNLTQVLKLSASEVVRQYVKGTLKAIDTQIITATNVSPDVDVQVSFGPQAGLVFDPSSFLVPPNSTRTTVLTFDLAKVDTLPEGLTVFNVPVSLTSPTAIAPQPVQAPAPQVVAETVAFVPPPPVIIYQAPPEPVSTPPAVVVESPPPAPAPAPPPAGRWVLTEVEPAYSTEATITSFRAPENGQEPGERNGFAYGMYDTTYGYTRTTTYGPLYDYTLEGNAQTAGTKPMAPARSVTVSEDAEKYQVLSNVYLRSMAEQAALMNGQATPLPPAPTPPPAPPSVIDIPTAVEPTPSTSGGGSAGGGSGGRVHREWEFLQEGTDGSSGMSDLAQT